MKTIKEIEDIMKDIPFTGIVEQSVSDTHVQLTCGNFSMIAPKKLWNKTISEWQKETQKEYDKCLTEQT